MGRYKGRVGRYVGWVGIRYEGRVGRYVKGRW